VGAGSPKEGGWEDGLRFIIGSSHKKETIVIGVRFEYKILAPTSLNEWVRSEVIMCVHMMDGWACCIEVHGYAPEEKKF